MKKGLVKAGLLLGSVFLLAACGTKEDVKETESEVSTEEVVEGESEVEGGELNQDQLNYDAEDPRTEHAEAEEQHYLVASDPLEGSNWGYMLEAFSDKEDKVSFTYFYYVGEGNVLEYTEDVKGAYKAITGEDAPDMSDEEIVKAFNDAARKFETAFVEAQSLEGLKAEGIIEETVLEHYRGAIAQLLMMVENPENFQTAGDLSQEELEAMGATEEGAEIANPEGTEEAAVEEDAE